MNKRALQTQFRSMLKMLDKRYVGSVYAALKGQIRGFTNDLRAGGEQYARRRLDNVLLNEKIAVAIKKIHVDAGVILAQQTYSKLIKIKPVASQASSKGLDTLYQPPLLVKMMVDNEIVYATVTKQGYVTPSGQLIYKYRGFGFNQQWANDIQNYFDKYLLNKAVLPITETTKDIILRTLRKAIDEGWGVEETIRQLNAPEITRNRAKMIVRTETVRAANYGILLGAETYDYETEKEWLSVHDRRTRHSHHVIDGQRRNNTERFGNGLLFPGDPTGTAKEVINCRCRLVIVPKRDGRQRLIPKKSTLRVQPGGSFREQIAELLNETV